MDTTLARTLPAGCAAVVRAATTADPCPSGVEPDVLAALGFTARLDEVAVLPPAAAGEPVCVVVGMGAPASGVGPTEIRRAAAVGVRTVRDRSTVAVDLAAGSLP